ncbi:DNA alkylation repair protein [Vibrio sp. HN007]|uniref:DNA alkylation repair protein n=1 Tax=Vibrio iocasae TaxID=3098914 RepID=UPI0035D4642A
MPEPFKNLLGPALVNGIAKNLIRVHPHFDSDGFVQAIIPKLDDLELKQRSDLICEQLSVFLPKEFPEAGDILLKSLGTSLTGESMESKTDENGIAGWAIMPVADFVARNGQEHFELSMTLLKEMTRRFSSEFAIRPFLDTQTEATLEVVHHWAVDEDQHVRRLASEGTRPRLPWGMRLGKFVKDPSQIIPVLEKLKDDESEYVRRSVANNLNDISKDHPDLVAEVVEEWLVDASENRKKLVRHACRTLIKSGHPATLSILGFKNPKLASCTLNSSSNQLIYGGSVDLNALIESDSDVAQPLMIDYVVHHQKANGTTSPKVFKWKSVDLLPGKKLAIKKKHSIKPVTTRVYYPGLHKVELQINGEVVAETGFELIMPDK